jgi:hypothetical protein
MVQSTNFKKWSGIIGGFAAGLWFSMNYHREIRATLAIWGVDKDQWGNFLILVIGASGVAASVGFSMAKSRLAARDDALSQLGEPAQGAKTPAPSGAADAQAANPLPEIKQP